MSMRIILQIAHESRSIKLYLPNNETETGMELVSFGKEILQNAAEQVASYRIGQTILRQLDRVLWVVEKAARWAVPPPLDQDERPQPELIRPLPWVFFLMLLIVLRVTREAVSLFNLILGKPPLCSADVVVYIVSKRRYLRTLKYQGNRMMRARTSAGQPPQGWMSKIQSLFEVTMCFRRQDHYGNNNTSTNNEELLVIKRSKRPREPATPAPASETSMERLIEKMMVDLDADSDEDSSYTLTNATSLRSDRSDTADSDQEALHNDTHTTQEEASPIKTDASPTKTEPSPNKTNPSPTKSASPAKSDTTPTKLTNNSPKNNENSSPKSTSTPEKLPNNIKDDSNDDKALQSEEQQFNSPKTESLMFLESEKRSPTKIHTSPKSEQKIANGRTVSALNKKRGNHVERRDADAPVTRKADMSF